MPKNPLKNLPSVNALNEFVQDLSSSMKAIVGIINGAVTLVNVQESRDMREIPEKVVREVAIT